MRIRQSNVKLKMVRILWFRVNVKHILKVSAEVNWTLIKRKVEVKEGSEKFFTLAPF